jgi:hypothetical protein
VLCSIVIFLGLWFCWDYSSGLKTCDPDAGDRYGECVVGLAAGERRIAATRTRGNEATQRFKIPYLSQEVV